MSRRLLITILVVALAGAGLSLSIRAFRGHHPTRANPSATEAKRINDPIPATPDIYPPETVKDSTGQAQDPPLTPNPPPREQRMLELFTEVAELAKFDDSNVTTDQLEEYERNTNRLLAIKKELVELLGSRPVFNLAQLL